MTASSGWIMVFVGVLKENNTAHAMYRNFMIRLIYKSVLQENTTKRCLEIDTV